MRIAIVGGGQRQTLRAVRMARSMGLADCILIDSRERLRSIAHEQGIDLTEVEIVEEEDMVEGERDSGDSLLDLLVQNREYLKKGDYRMLYAIWQSYGFAPEDEYDEEFEEEAPPEPPDMEQLPEPMQTLLSNLE